MKVLALVCLSMMASICPIHAVAQSEPDTVKARTLLDEARKNIANPALADSLAAMGYRLAGENLKIKGECAYIICFVNSPINFNRARQWGDSAVAVFTLSDNNLWLGYTHRVLGIRSQALKRNDLSLQYLLESSRFFDRANDTLMLIQSDVSLSQLYHNNLSDFTTGLKYAQQAHRRLEQLKSPEPSLGWLVYNMLAINYDDLGDSAAALDWHRKNLATDNPNFRARTLNNIGNTLRKMGRAQEAASYFTKSVALTQPDDVYMRATVYLNLAQVNDDLHQRSLASKYNDSSLWFAEKSRDLEKIRDSYEFAHRFYRSSGNLLKAYDCLNRYMEVKDSTLTRDKAEIIYEMEERYQSLQKEGQIAQLKAETSTKDLALERSQVVMFSGVAVGAALLMAGWMGFRRHQYRTNLQRAEEREELQRQRFGAVIEAEENERMRVAKDLHDGLGQLISTAKLGLTAITPAQEAQSRLLSNSIQVLEQATQEVRSIAHNLMPAALTERGLVVALEDMIQKINEARLLDVKLQASIGEDRLPTHVEIAVYRVVQEALNNMLRHSKADRIFVRLQREGKSLHLSLTDNGVGFDRGMVTQSKGLGWKNIFSRIALLNGTIDVDSRPGAGTSITIQLAVA